MKLNDILEELEINDLPEQYRKIAQSIGIKAFLELTRNHGGTSIYIPMTYEITRDFKYRKILEEYDGDNRQQLAVKYGISESTVYRILKDKITEKRREPMEGQLKLI